MPQERKPRFEVFVSLIVPAADKEDARRKVDSICHSIGVMSRYQASIEGEILPCGSVNNAR